jgi:hypothetical protein
MNEHEKRLGDALAEILIAIEKHIAEMAQRPPAAAFGGPMSLDEFDAFLKKGEVFMADPVAYALRLGVKHVGEILVRNSYGERVALEVAEYASVKTRNYAFASGIVDKWWDGLQFADGSFWAA